MATLEQLGIDDVQAALSSFRDALVDHKPRINALNVYPVPDGDTGTNMSLTLESVMAEVDQVPVGPADGHDAAVWHAISHGSLMGARGNSGVILSQILRGLSDVLSTADTVDVDALTRALRASADAAYGAVMRPVEGTILTVIREVAEEAESGRADDLELVELLDRCAARGADALERTPDLLPVLADAGVVDAGGAGLLLLFDAMLHVVDGRPLPEAGEAVGPVGQEHDDHGDADVGDLRYEVMYFLEAPDPTIDTFKSAWAELGDSIVVVGGDGVWNCHIHTNDIGATIEAALEHGRPSQIRVTDLFEQVEHLEHHEDLQSDDGASLVSLHNPDPCTTAAVAVAVGPGVRRIFESLGVQAVITGGQTMNPSTAQLLQAVDQVPADEVVILPNNKNIIPVAEQVDGQTTKVVRVVPTRGIAEGFASLLAYDPGTDADTNAESMAMAAEDVVAGEVTRAVRASQTDVGPVVEGDWIGLGRAGVRSIGQSIAAAAVGLLDDLVTDDHELVTVIAGADATPEATAEIESWLAEHRTDVEVEVHNGDQPLYPYYFGIE